MDKPGKYWYRRLDQNKMNQSFHQAQYKKGLALNGLISQNQNEGQRQASSSKPNEKGQQKQKNLIGIGFLQKSQTALQNVVSKLTKIQDYYQIMCSGEFSNMGIRCYQHNNELILYCCKDHQLLCAYCMYGNLNNNQNTVSRAQKLSTTNMDANKNNQLSLQIEDKIDIQEAQKGVETERTISKSRTKDNKRRNKKNANNSAVTHDKHEVKQINKSSVQIADDVKTWQYQIQQKLSIFSNRQGNWQRLCQSFTKTRQKLLGELNIQYDKIQMQLSKRYTQAKKQIKQISQKYETHIERVVEFYKIIKRLAIPSRYPVPSVKHCWLTQTMKIIETQMPIQNKETTINWVRNYETNGKFIINKFSNWKT